MAKTLSSLRSKVYGTRSGVEREGGGGWDSNRNDVKELRKTSVLQFLMQVSILTFFCKEEHIEIISICLEERDCEQERQLCG